MKHGKNPNVRQKKLMTQEHLNYESWLVVKDTPTVMEIVHRNTGEIKTISKMV
jgi:hypothetical protein